MPFRRTILHALAAAVLALAGTAAALGSMQLVTSVEQQDAYLNGEPVRLNAPRVIRGRTMLPLRDTARLLELPLDTTADTARIGPLSIDLRSGRAQLFDAPQHDATASIDGQTYVSARLLAEALGANLSFSDDNRTLTLTVLRNRTDSPLAPQARFSTDKTTYAPGERIVYTEYSFDPDGADITARRWTGRQDAYFQPGTYTVTLQVTNARNLQSAPFTRTIRVEGPARETPISYALRHGEIGDAFPDPDILTYPVVSLQPIEGPSYPLLFSDSPETPTQSGTVYQDTISGTARLLAYHINGLQAPARLYILARNTERRTVEVRTLRMGETAPTRIESILGQVTLMEYFASSASARLSLEPGMTAAVYASPLLNPGSGVNVMQDIETTGSVELTFLFVEHTLPPTAQVVRQLPVLPPDGKHQRGTFPNAVRTLQAKLDQLPARIVIGDGTHDLAVEGVDALTGAVQRLAGNYGVLYDLVISGTSGTAVALSARGGLYRGAMQITDGPLTRSVKLPRTGLLTRPDAPALVWRPVTDTIRLDFVPASGSNLPVSFVFYRPGGGGPAIRKHDSP